MRWPHGDEATERIHDVGLLFVHGIGEQQRGSFLVEAGDSLVGYLRSEDFTARLGGAPMARLGSVSIPIDEPASAVVEFEAAPGRAATPGSASWLLAESNWARAFVPPGAGTTLRWILLRTPGLVVVRAIESLIAAVRAWGWRPQYWWRIVLQALWTAVSLPLVAAVLVILVVSVLLRALIPFAWLQTLLGKIEVLLTTFIGDSLLFSESAINSAAMSSVVARDLNWLAARCRTLLVVAHSQGAAVTAQALEQTPPVHVLVTYGAGISQLRWLRSVSRRENVALALISLLVLGLVGVVVFTVVDVFRGAEVPGWMVALLIFGWPTLAAFLQSMAKQATATTREARLRPDSRRLAERWVDLWASADPVNGGPSTRTVYEQVEEIRVWNHGNVITDHSSYFSNRAEFVSRIAAYALGATRTFPPGSAAALEQRATVRGVLRQRRGRWLEAFRASLAVLVVAAVLRFSGDLAHVMSPLVDRLAEVLPGRLAPVFGIGPEVIAAGVVIVLVGLACYALALLAWAGWELVEERASTGDAADERGSSAMVVVAGLLTNLALVTAALVWFDWSDAGRLLEVAYTLPVLCAVATGAIWVVVRMTRRIWSRRARTDQALSARALWHGFLGGLLLWSVVIGVVGLERFEASQTNWSIALALVSSIAVLAMMSEALPPRRRSAGWSPVRDPRTYQPFKYLASPREDVAPASAPLLLLGVLAGQAALLVFAPTIPEQAEILVTFLVAVLPFAALNVAVWAGDRGLSGARSAVSWVLVIASFVLSTVFVVVQVTR
ncbi:hypothetical protein [Agromyces sp. C10]|uniref:hypothetical protein n=1 Tax=Agromyces sp. C10 TaxID=2935077 RepID=UPI00200A159B|nr:hypothetical protein [Agromyces sp. C10]MCK8607918.1 hypothetical protein [Agromyces sp. C10]